MTSDIHHPDLWLTRIRLNPEATEARRDLASAPALHQTLMRLFPDALGERPRQTAGVLFRLEEQADTYAVLIQSAMEPELDNLPVHYGSALAKPLTPLLKQLQEGMTVRYRITANATRRLAINSDRGRVGQRLPLHGPEAEAWWQRQATTAGLALHETLSTRLPDAAGTRTADHRRITHARTRFDGTATISDPEQTIQHIHDGIGRGKSYGCGLLSLAPCDKTEDA
ncbi:type I-E CRISPR-associated protein Cas6/Cse3/CasE [Streptomyces sp. NPDC048172]|uniref:type I-E CRISPR-associated protein Cas6/Cse3/CasE n=1 Tax=Streptomyces sp. NPDC048172 TaxID=3365505 RepID=UPI003714E5F7